MVPRNDYFSTVSSKDEATGEQFWGVIRPFFEQTSNSNETFSTKRVCANNEKTQV